MIRRERGDLVAECDDCGTDTEHQLQGCRDFLEFVAELKDDGWKVFKDEDGEWRHLCPDCVGETDQ